jgi:hypothetical protein
MKNILLFLILIYGLSSQAATYYVKNTGNNSNTGLSDAQAWQTLSKVVGTIFTIGDTVKLKCGDLWTETFNLGSGNVVITSYGSGAKPEIRGWGDWTTAMTSENWSEYSSGIWRMTVGNSGTRLWLNNKERKESKTTTLTDEYCWHYDGTYFYLKSPSNPATYYNSIAVSTGNQYDLVTITGKENVTFDGINFSGGRYCLRLTNIKNWKIKNCEIGYRTNGTGMWVTSTGGDSCVSVLIHDNIYNSGDSLTYNYYRGNGTIRPLDMTTSDAVNLQGIISNCSVYDNYIYGWSHDGIYFIGTHRNTHAYRNFITAPFVSYSRGMSADLSSAIDCSMHDNTIYATTIQNQMNAHGVSANDFKFYNNIIDGVAGTTFPEKPRSGVGISSEAYDTNPYGQEIYGNLIFNCKDWGIKIAATNTNTYNNYHDNNVFNCGTDVNYNHQLKVYLDADVHHNTFTNNHFYNATYPNTVSYQNGTYTASAFNSVVTTNGDIISGTDEILTFDVEGFGTKTVTIDQLRVEHNATASDKTITLTTPMISTKGSRYVSSATIPAYSSLILLEDGRIQLMHNGRRLKHNGKALKN